MKSDKSEDFLKTAKPRSKQRNITRSQPPKGSVLSSSRGSSQAKRKKAKRKKSRVKSRRIKKVSVQSTGRQTRRASESDKSSQSPDVSKLRRKEGQKSRKRRKQSRRGKRSSSRKSKRQAKKKNKAIKAAPTSKPNRGAPLRKLDKRKVTKLVKQSKKRKLTGAGLLHELGQLGTIPSIEAEKLKSSPMVVERDTQTITFRRGSFQIARQSESQLSAIADFVNATPSILAVFVIGHADDSLMPSESGLLSEARASAVAEGLVRNGVSIERIVAFGVDREFPKSASPKENRRVEVEYIHQIQKLRQSSNIIDTASMIHFGVWAQSRSRESKVPLPCRAFSAR